MFYSSHAYVCERGGVFLKNRVLEGKILRKKNTVWRLSVFGVNVANLVFESSQKNWKSGGLLTEGLAWPELCRWHWKLQVGLDVCVLRGDR